MRCHFYETAQFSQQQMRVYRHVRPAYVIHMYVKLYLIACRSMVAIPKCLRVSHFCRCGIELCYRSVVQQNTNLWNNRDFVQ